MIVQRSERFDTDLERQFRWYLLETDLDPVEATALATRFAEAVDTALEVLGGILKSGDGDLGPTLTLLERARGGFGSPSAASSFSTGLRAESFPPNACWKATADWPEDSKAALQQRQTNC